MGDKGCHGHAVPPPPPATYCPRVAWSSGSLSRNSMMSSRLWTYLGKEPVTPHPVPPKKRGHPGDPTPGWHRVP